ncbi:MULTISPECIES: CPBP family intramembrane glutamic endopeptidase [Paraburkholderia]|uniref:Uncharacterized protein n=1 Tax=Paraburkholderia youngii TaxID=2782701 RepID=A0A7Y6K7L8_9BURK|nr:CPBP family intramembrane glutamic endopeptidase [Paraburkholderia youngii]NUX58367.1 hypothetical protein [Paraburkholderia youngii]NUY05451.1 hypothetical protein [Paraburkholderia youngii]
MQNDRPPPRRVTYEKGIRIGGSGWFGRLLTVALSAILFVVAATLSIVLFAVLFAVGTVVVGYLWWKMRKLRRQAAAYGDDGRTVDMEVVHRDTPDDDGRTIDMELVHKDPPRDDSAPR